MFWLIVFAVICLLTGMIGWFNVMIVGLFSYCGKFVYVVLWWLWCFYLIDLCCLFIIVLWLVCFIIFGVVACYLCCFDCWLYVVLQLRCLRMVACIWGWLYVCLGLFVLVVVWLNVCVVLCYCACVKCFFELAICLYCVYGFVLLGCFVCWARMLLVIVTWCFVVFYGCSVMFCLNNELIGYGCAGWCCCLVLFIVRSYYCKLFDVVFLFGYCLFGWLFAVGCDSVLFWLLIVLFVDCGFWCCCWDSCCCRCCVCLCVFMC